MLRARDAEGEAQRVQATGDGGEEAFLPQFPLHPGPQLGPRPQAPIRRGTLQRLQDPLLLFWGQLGPLSWVGVPPVLQGLGAFLVGAPHHLLDPAGAVHGDLGDLLSGAPLLGVVDRQKAGSLYRITGLLDPLR